MVLVKPRRPLAPVQFLQDTISRIVSASDDDALIAVLLDFDAPNQFERPEERNLTNWYRVLNRFDQLLERYISEHDILKKESNVASKDQAKNLNESSEHSNQLWTTNSFLTSNDPSQPATPTTGFSSRGISEKVQTGSDVVQASENNGTNDTEGSVALFTPSASCVRLILRQTRELIRNASHDSRHVYNSVEHLTALLADGHSAIVLLSLEILHLLYQKSGKLRTSRPGFTFELIQRLMEISIGWGGRERGLGLVECCRMNTDKPLPNDGKQLHFKYAKSSSGSSSDQLMLERARWEWSPTIHEPLGRKASNGSGNVRSSSSTPLPLPQSTTFDVASPRIEPTVTTVGSVTSIVSEDVQAFNGDERWLLTEFASKHGIPKNKLFSLLYACRRARAFGQGRVGRIEACILRMYALTILFLLHPMNPSKRDLAKETELLQDVITVARAEAKDGLDDIPLCLRSICIRLLNAFASDRRRLTVVLMVTGLDAHHGSLTTLLRSEIRSILDNSQNVNPAAMDCNVDRESALRTEKGLGTSQTSSLSVASECMTIRSRAEHYQVAESLLALVHSLAIPTSSSNAGPFTSSGVLNILVPLLNDQDVSHSRVVTRAIRAMQAIIEGSTHSSGTQVFREQNGLTLIADRIAAETDVDKMDKRMDFSEEDEKVEIFALQKRGESREFYNLLKEKQMTYAEALEHQPPSSSATSRGQLPHSQWSLLRSLHQLLIPALGSGGNEVRELVANSKLPNALRKILGQPFYYGGSLFQSAASVTTNIAHAEPTATVELVDAGIATTVLRSIEAGLPPCGEAIKCIPNLLAALCLAPKARDIVVSKLPLKDFLLRLATPFYTRALHGDIPVHVGNGLDELVRHVEALRESGNEAMEAYIGKSAAFVDSDDRDLRRALTAKGKPEKKTTAATASESKIATKTTCMFGDGTKSPFEQILLDKMKLAVANNAYRLAGLSQNSPEHQERLVKGTGLQDMIRMRKAAAYASAEAAVRDGQNFSRHYPTPSTVLASLVVSLRAINSRHPSNVLKALFSVILEDSSKVLKAAKNLGDVWLPEEEISEEKKGSISQEGERANSEQRGLSKHREDLKTNIKILRVDVVLLNGLLRGALGSTTTFWGNCGGAEVATVISTIERAARYHLAMAYTGLILSAPDGDLTIAAVTAAANPLMKSLQPSSLNRYVGNVDKLLGAPISKSKGFEDACKKFTVPPQTKTFYRQKVKGMAWQLVTYAVAVQNLYLTLSKGLTLTLRRNARSSNSYAARARSLSATIGRIFVLHLKAAEPLWRVQVATMGKTGVIAAWDYIRGVLIEIKGTVFDEHRRGTQSMILKSFFEAGGFEVLLSVTRPMEIAKVAARGLGESVELFDIRDSLYRKSVDDPITTSSYILALAEALPSLKASKQSDSPKRPVVVGTPDGDKSEMEVSSDSVTNQAKGIAKIAVTDSNADPDISSKSSDEALRALLRDEKALSALRYQVINLSSRALAAHIRFSVRKVASDVWNSLCAFLLSLGSCPGLLGTDGPINEGPTTSSDWTKEEIQRTSLTVALRMLYPVTKENPDLLSVLRQDDSASADFVALIHTASQIARDLCKRDNSDAIDTNGSGDNNSRPGLVADLRIRNTPSPDPSILRALTEMGFPERLARVAIRRTAPGGVEHATEWLISHIDGDEDSLPSDEERNWDGDEQGSGDERDREQNSNPEDEDDEPPQSGEGLDSDTNALQLIDDSLQVPHTPIDEIMIDAGSADPADDSENDNSNGGSSPVPSLSSRDNDDEPQREVGPNSKQPASNVKVVSRNVDQDGPDLLKRSIQKDIQLLRVGLRQSPDIKAQEISDIVKFTSKSISEYQSSTDLENGLDSEALKITPVPVDIFKKVKQDVFESLLEVIKDIVHHAQSGNKDVSFLCVEILSALQKDGILSKQRLDDVARLMKEGLMMSFGSTQSTYAVSRVAALWAHYGGYRGRQSLKNCEVFDLAFKTLRRLVSELETLSKDPNVDEEATQPIKQLSIKEEQSSRGGRSSGGRKRRHVERGSKEAPQSAQPGLASSLPRTMSKEEQLLVRRITTCMLLLDARYRYEFKDNIIEISKRDEDSGTGKDRKADGAEDRMEIEDMTGAMDRAINDAHPLTLFEDHGTQNGAAEQLADESGDLGGDVDMSSPNGQDLDAKSKLKEVAVVNEELSRIKDLALRTKKAIVDRTKKAVSEVVPKVELEESERLQRQSVLSICLQCLRIWRNVKVGDALVATLQLLASLTRDWDLAKKGYESGIVDSLLALRQLDRRSFHGSEYRVVRALVKTILRHIVEDPKTLEEAMVTEIQTFIAQPRARSPNTVKSLLTASAPLLSRNIDCFVSAAAQTIKANDLTQLQVQEQKPASLEDMKEQLPKRPNVKEVIWGMAGLLEAKPDKEISSAKNVVSSAALNRNQEMSQFALETLADLIQLFQIAAVAFISAKSPSSTIQGSALDYVVQECLTSEPATNFVPRSLSELVSPSESLESPAHRLLHALCSKSANTHIEAVHALAAAARIEADKEIVDVDAISGIASCVTSGTKLRVLRAMLSTSLPNDLARSLKKMDTSVSKHFEVTKSVLKALAWLGQAAGNIAKGGDAGNDDISFPNAGSRRWWEAMSPNHMLE